MGGRILGLARHVRPRAPMETLDQIEVTIEGGITGDFRGALKPGGRNRRQVTMFAAAGWQDALDELGTAVPWEQRRVNILVDGLVLAGTTGSLIRFSGGVELLVTGECDPCSRMEEVAPGLKAALLPHWRGGIISRVLAGGTLAIGDEVRIEGP